MDMIWHNHIMIHTFDMLNPLLYDLTGFFQLYKRDAEGGVPYKGYDS